MTGDPSNSKEKRRFTRVPFRVRAEMSVEEIVYSTEDINNLGVGGCLLPIKADLKPGTPCDVRIQLSETGGDLNIRVTGKILRCEPGAVAVQFTHIDPDSLFHLQNIILYNSPDPDTTEQEIAEHPTPMV